MYSQGIPGKNIDHINWLGTWDPSNTADFLNYTQLHQLPVFGFELGNELNLAKYPASACANDFHTLRSILDGIFQENSSRPLLIGPDEGANVPFLIEFLNATGSIMDAVTYHLYLGYGLDPSKMCVKLKKFIELPDEILEPKFLNRSREWGTQILEVVKEYAPNAQLWCGETAAAYHSGDISFICKISQERQYWRLSFCLRILQINDNSLLQGQVNTTNAFVSGFWYLDQLGTLAQLEHKVFCRQTLVGGDYEVIAKDTFLPNPDYWTGS